LIKKELHQYVIHIYLMYWF